MSFKSVGCAVLQPRSSFNSAFQATETFNYLDGSKYYTWTAVRRQNIDKLVSSIIRITVFVTAAQAFGGQAPYLPYARGVTDPSQHGIAYQLGAVTWWLLSLVITPLVAILWFPLFKVRPLQTLLIKSPRCTSSRPFQSLQSTDLFIILSGSLLQIPQTRRMSYPMLLQEVPWRA